MKAPAPAPAPAEAAVNALLREVESATTLALIHHDLVILFSFVVQSNNACCCTDSESTIRVGLLEAKSRRETRK